MPGPSGSAKSAQAARIHLDGARECLAFSHIVPGVAPGHCGWAATAVFYAAVHLVRAYLVAVKDCVLTSHEDLRKKYDDYPELNRIRASYEHLKQQSEKARYYMTPFTPGEVESLRAKLDVIQKTVIPWLSSDLQDYFNRTTQT